MRGRNGVCMEGGLESGMQLRVKSCFSVPPSLIRVSQELVNQQGRLHSPVSNDPAALELLLSLDVSVLSPCHTGGQHSITAGFCALFVPAGMFFAAHSGLVHGIPSRKSFLPSQYHCEFFFFFGSPLARLALGQGQGWLCGGAVGIGLICC